MNEALECFKAYDIRGRLPDQLNEDIAYRIGRAFAQHLGASKVAVGYDIRDSSPSLTAALVKGLADSGCDSLNIGLCGTEEIYHATAHFDLDGGIMVTASHNPIDYNGLKLVRSGARPISGDSGLNDIRDLVIKNKFPAVEKPGTTKGLDARGPYLSHLLSYVDILALKPLRIVSNPGNGGAGIIIDALEPDLPFEFIKIHHDPDGSFPNGIPNPLLKERRAATIDAVLESKADFGLSWDGDFDRCFLVDEKGRFIEGYYIVGLLAQAFLDKHPAAKIIHDPRLTWNTIDIVKRGGGIPIMSKTGHAFIKERMRAEDAVYGGEMSAHHYFRDFNYCDSGMIVWLLISELVSRSGQPLSALVDDRMQAYPCSGEINFRVDDAASAVARIAQHFRPKTIAADNTDGLSMEFEDWRFNVRSSNTEPLLRLNVETRANPELLEIKTRQLSELIGND